MLPKLSPLAWTSPTEQQSASTSVYALASSTYWSSLYERYASTKDYARHRIGLIAQGSSDQVAAQSLSFTCAYMLLRRLPAACPCSCRRGLHWLSTLLSCSSQAQGLICSPGSRATHILAQGRNDQVSRTLAIPRRPSSSLCDAAVRGSTRLTAKDSSRCASVQNVDLSCQ